MEGSQSMNIIQSDMYIILWVTNHMLILVQNYDFMCETWQKYETSQCFVPNFSIQ